MNKPITLITKISIIVLLSLSLMLAVSVVAPVYTSAAPCSETPDDPFCTPDEPPEDDEPPETPPGDDDTGGGSGSATKDDVCEGLEVATGVGCDEKVKGGSVENVVATVINVLSWIVGIAAVIMLIISGFRFVVSSGDTQAVANAKNGIIYAILGLLVVLFAQVIVQFVITTAVPT